jgi:tol-pal system protein YbgF
MGLNYLIDSSSLRRHSWFIILVLFAFLLVGCSETEEVVKQEPQAQGVKPAEENTSDQALTSFIGANTEQPEAPAPAPAVSPTQLALYEKQIGDLRTENTGLKQNIVKLEQENRSINARMTEVDAKYAVEKHRADSIDMLIKSPDLTAKTQKPMLEEEKTTLTASQATYDNAMKAFKARKYDNARKGFEAIVDVGANDDFTNRSRYWLGETYFAQKKYKQALPLFEEVIKNKYSGKNADAQYMIGRAYENLGSKAKAKAAYEKVVKNYPMSKNVKSAKARWARL